MMEITKVMNNFIDWYNEKNENKPINKVSQFCVESYDLHESEMTKSKFFQKFIMETGEEIFNISAAFVDKHENIVLSLISINNILFELILIFNTDKGNKVEFYRPTIFHNDDNESFEKTEEVIDNYNEEKVNETVKIAVEVYNKLNTSINDNNFLKEECGVDDNIDDIETDWI